MGVAETVEAARRLQRLGYGTLKLKLGPDVPEIRRVEAVREVVGSGMRIRLDPNACWSPDIARQRLKALGRLDIEYVEQPVPEARALERLAADSPIPIAPDESMEDVGQARKWLTEATFEFAIVKPAILGGLDNVAELVALAAANNVQLVVTDRLETAVGRMAALHAACLLPDPVPACGLDGGRWLERDVAETPAWAPSPTLARPSAPGLGIVPLLGGAPA